MTLSHIQNRQKSYNHHQSHSLHYLPPINLPKSLIESHSSIIGLIPKEQNSQFNGRNCFWPIMLSYLQIQHLNIEFSKILTKQKIPQPQNDQKEEERSQDAVSNGSSINIRQRKVSFGIINYRNQENNKKKTKKPSNLCIILNQNDQNKLNSIPKIQPLVNTLINKTKLLLYQYAHQKDKKQKDSKPIHSLEIANALEFLFPKQQKTLKDIFLYQKTKINSIFQALTSQKIASNSQNTTNSFQRSVKIIFEALNTIGAEKILNRNMQIHNFVDKNLEKQSEFLRNMRNFMKYFGFQQGQDFEIFSRTNQNNPQSSQFLGKNLDQSESKSIETQMDGIEFKKGFFRVFCTDNGYLTSINIECLENLVENVKKLFLKPFDPELTRQHVFPHNFPSESKSPQGTGLSWQETHFHRVSASNFIARYNNRYFKNQRLIYKQKSKLESRFKEQDVGDMIPQEGFEFGYENVRRRQSSSRHREHLMEMEKEEQPEKIIEKTIENSQAHVIMNPTLEHSFAQRKQFQGMEIKENYKEKFMTMNDRPFYVQEEQEVIEYQAKDDTKDDRSDYSKKRLSREEEIERLYQKVDFQISDNEILDDIERVLI